MNLEDNELEIPKKYKDATNARKARDWFLPFVSDYLKDVDLHRKCGAGALLSGSHGCGKTWTACALANTIDHEANRRVVIVFQHASELLDRAYRMGEPVWVPGWDQTYDAVIESCSCLILDDLGFGVGVGGSQTINFSKLNRLLRKRANNNRLTLVTTNLTLKVKDDKAVSELEKELTSALVSVLDELCPFQVDVGVVRDSRASKVREY